MGIETFVFGILSVYFSNSTGLLGIICGILGLVRAKKALASNPDDKFAKAGRICSIIGIVNSALVVLFLVGFFVLYFGLLFTIGAFGALGAM